MPQIPLPKPATTEDVSSITFCVESMMTKGGRKAFKPDRDGYYVGVPQLVIGATTRANSLYTANSVEEQITSPNSSFAVLLREGCLHGERGHPDIDLIDDPKKQMARMLRVDERLFSHHYRKVYSGPNLEGGGKLILADVKPVEPYGNALKQSAEDPNINTAFSLRSITKNRQVGNVSRRDILRLITIDSVGAPGFIQASKAFAPISTESFHTPDGGKDMFTMSLPTGEDGKIVIDQLSMESFTDTEINEILGTNHVQTLSRQRTICAFRDPSVIGTQRRTASFFGDFVRAARQEG